MTPAYLKRCLAAIDERERAINTWVMINRDRARSVADAATERYRAGKPISSRVRSEGWGADNRPAVSLRDPDKLAVIERRRDFGMAR